MKRSLRERSCDEEDVLIAPVPPVSVRGPLTHENWLVSLSSPRWGGLCGLWLADVPDRGPSASPPLQECSRVHHQEEIQEVPLQVGAPLPAGLKALGGEGLETEGRGRMYCDQHISVKLLLQT